jgi:hypothetical protein
MSISYRILTPPFSHSPSQRLDTIHLPASGYSIETTARREIKHPTHRSTTGVSSFSQSRPPQFWTSRTKEQSTYTLGCLLDGSHGGVVLSPPRDKAYIISCRYNAPLAPLRFRSEWLPIDLQRRRGWRPIPFDSCRHIHGCQCLDIRVPSGNAVATESGCRTASSYICAAAFRPSQGPRAIYSRRRIVHTAGNKPRACLLQCEPNRLLSSG